MGSSIGAKRQGGNALGVTETSRIIVKRPGVKHQKGEKSVIHLMLGFTHIHIYLRPGAGCLCHRVNDTNSLNLGLVAGWWLQWPGWDVFYGRWDRFTSRPSLVWDQYFTVVCLVKVCLPYQHLTMSHATHIQRDRQTHADYKTLLDKSRLVWIML